MTSQFARFVDPARDRPQLWRLALGVVLILVSSVAAAVAVFGAAWGIAGDSDIPVWADGMAAADTPGGTLLLLTTFVGMAIGVALAARWLHRRNPGTLFGPGARTLRDFAKAFVTVSLLMALSLALWSLSYDAVPNLDLSLWLALLPLTVLGLLVQTGAEELVFRGYLQQQLAARFRATWIWMLVPAVGFGLVHYNPELSTEAAWSIVAAATIFGVAAADLTARTGSIGAAWGFHFANNLAAVAILSTDETINGLSLYRTPYTVEAAAGFDLLILLDIGYLVLAWWLVRRVVAR